MSDKSNEEFTLEYNPDASFIHVSENGYIKASFNACADEAKWLTSSSHNKESFKGRLPSLIVEVNLPSDKRECAPGEKEVVHKLHLLAGDVGANSKASVNHILDNSQSEGCLDSCAKQNTICTKNLRRNSFHVHLQDKRECAPGEEVVVHKLHLLAGDVETNPGPVVRPCLP